MLFPLPEESGVNWNAPVIDRQVFDAFRSRSELRDNMRKAFERMLWFYGFQLSTEGPSGKLKVMRGGNFRENFNNWNTRFDHNHLRITRIIRCLRVLGLEAEAQAFRSALEESTTNVSPRSREFWRRAAERVLNLRPDMEGVDDKDTAIGPTFLREYEEKIKARKHVDNDKAAVAEVGNNKEHEEAKSIEKNENVKEQGGHEGKEAKDQHESQKLDDNRIDGDEGRGKIPSKSAIDKEMD